MYRVHITLVPGLILFDKLCDYPREQFTGSNAAHICLQAFSFAGIRGGETIVIMMIIGESDHEK